MAKKTDLQNVIGRKAHRILYLKNRLPKPPHVEMVMVHDFTGKH